jgi:hypothetical protein
MACMFWRCCILYSSYFYLCIHKEKKEEKWNGEIWSWILQWAHGFWFCISQIIKAVEWVSECTGSSPLTKKTEYLVVFVICFSFGFAPWVERWSFIASFVKVFFFTTTCFSKFFCSVYRWKVGFATVDILVNSPDWIGVEGGGLRAFLQMADDWGNVYEDKYDKYDRRCKLIILPSLDPETIHSSNPWYHI